MDWLTSIFLLWYNVGMRKTFTKTQITNMKKAINSLSRSKIYTLDNYIKLTRKRLGKD